ncbi:MAG: hypothetical protein Q8M16_18815 [Pirellulaceae bacterium]|nr:hypothetical protein [Pirellulaceae bacterium]
MTEQLPNVKDLYSLLHDGVISSPTTGYKSLQSRGLVWCETTAGQVVMTERGLQVAGLLPTEAETVAGLLACLGDVRSDWLNIVAARLREAGQRRDIGELCQVIETLGLASQEVRDAIGNASLEVSAYAKLESELFGSGAEQPVNYPKLLRVLGRTAAVIRKELVTKPIRLKAVNPFEPKDSWCAGRVMQLPCITSPSPEAKTGPHRQPLSPKRGEGSQTFVLAGDCEDLSVAAIDAEDNESKALMRWVLYRPWCMLLAQIVFTQEAWGAEQISGQLSLELSDDQLGNPYEPKRIDVVVVRADGAEVLCGSLGELVQRVLQRLQIALVARPDQAARLDEYLAPVVRRLLERKVWRFDPRGGCGSRPGFTIDDDFSTSCYRAFGSKHFYRAGSVLTAAIRASAEQWAADRQTKSRALARSAGLAVSGDRS